MCVNKLQRLPIIGYNINYLKMSDDEDYSSSDDESSMNEDFMMSSSKIDGKLIDGGGMKAGTMGVLTLQDNEEDDSEFQRPDLAPVYAEDDGEGEEEGDSQASDEEIEGECDTFDGTAKMKKPRTKKTTGSGSGSGGARAKAKTGAKKSSYDDDSKKNKKKKKKPIGICLVATKYECVRRVSKKLAFKEVEEIEDWSLFWTDTSVSIDRVNQMKKWQVGGYFIWIYMVYFRIC